MPILEGPERNTGLDKVAVAISTAAGVLMGKAMNRLSKQPLNPLIGAAAWRWC